MILLSIDSSICKIGYAVFNTDLPINKSLISSGTLRIKDMMESEKVRVISLQIQNIIEKHDCQLAVIEKPERFSYTRSANIWGKGKNLEALRKNNIAVGIISTTCVHNGMNIELVTPQIWKGNQKKIMTLLKVNDEFGLNLKAKNYDESDAIGIGMWYMERDRLQDLIRKSASPSGLTARQAGK